MKDIMRAAFDTFFEPSMPLWSVLFFGIVILIAGWRCARIYSYEQDQEILAMFETLGDIAGMGNDQYREMKSVALSAYIRFTKARLKGKRK